MKIIITIILLATPFLFQACDSNDACELTQDDKAWLLEGYDSLYYQLNGSSTIKASVESGISQNEYDYQWGIRTGDNNYVGYTTYEIFENDSNAIGIYIYSEACKDNLHLVVLDLNYADQTNIVRNVDDIKVNKGSFNTNSYKVINNDYYNWIKIDSTQTSIVNSFTFCKNYGLIQLVSKQGETYNILPLNFEE